MSVPVTPSFRLDGKRAIVTGAGRGIGLAMAAALAQAGADVTLVARTAAEVEAAAKAVGGTAAVLDVSNLTAVKDFFAHRPAFNILVNNAGTNRPKPMIDVSETDYDAVYDLNVKSAFFVAQACVQRMIAEKITGSLIHIGSQMGHVGGPNRSLYCGSKWALEGMNKAFALDLAAYNIRSNTIAPTFIETPMTKPMLENPEFKREVLSNIPLGHLGSMEDVAEAVLFLIGPAARMITGSSLLLDGGWTAR